MSEEKPNLESGLGQCPNEQLAKKIGQRLLESSLVTEEDLELILSAMKSGTASQDDWRSWLLKKIQQAKA